MKEKEMGNYRPLFVNDNNYFAQKRVREENVSIFDQ